MQFGDSVNGVFEKVGAWMIPVPLFVGAFLEAEICPEINYSYVSSVNFFYKFGGCAVWQCCEYHVGIVWNERRVRIGKFKIGYSAEVRKNFCQRAPGVP